MAGYPPPYPGFDPKQQARFARQQFKAQARAQQAAIRAQRDLYRYQSRAYRRSSILTPVIVLCVGVLALLIHLDRIPAPTFWAWYGRWWPLLLVLAGIVLVAEWAFDQATADAPRPDGAPAVTRTRFTGGAGFLLTLLVVTGIAAHVFANHQDFLNHTITLDSDHFMEFFGNKHESTQDLEEDLAPNTALVISNPHGDITVAGKSGDNKLHITVDKQVYSSSDSDADAKSRRLDPVITTVDGALTVTVPSLEGASADLVVTVPDSAQTTITANHGDIAISNLHAPVTLTANHGDIELNAITGAVIARVNHSGTSVTAHTITGNLAIQGHAQDITITDVTGQTSLDGEFGGDIHLEHLRGLFTFHSQRTQFSLQRLDGELDIDGDNFDGNQLVGPTTLRTRSRNITFDHVSGDVNVADSDGTVTLTGLSPLGNIAVENKNGEVDVTLPEKSPYNVFAQTEGGTIDSDLPLKPSTSNNLTVLQGDVGSGGPSINLHTTHLDINLRQAAIVPPPPSAPPTPPTPAPKSPSKPKPPALPAT